MKTVDESEADAIKLASYAIMQLAENFFAEDFRRSVKLLIV